MKESLHFAGLPRRIPAQCNSAPGRAWPEARLLTGNSMEVIPPVMSWTYASGQRKRRLDGHPVGSQCRKLPRGADAVGPGNPGWSSCQKDRRVRTANRWTVGKRTRRAAVRFKRPSGRRTRLSRARLGKAAGVPRGADDPQGPNRPGAGGFSPAGHPDGTLGGCPSQVRATLTGRPRQDRPPPPRRDPVGAGYSVTSCDLRILMDQSTESISSHDPPIRHEGRWWAGPERWRLPQGTVRSGGACPRARCGRWPL
jgi:hypothetical protein